MIATLMKLLLIRMVASRRFGISRRRATCLSRFPRFCLTSLSWAGLSEKKATSDADIIAEAKRSMKITIMLMSSPNENPLVIPPGMINSMFRKGSMSGFPEVNVVNSLVATKIQQSENVLC